MRPDVRIGDFVGVACDVEPGPFEGEKLITVGTLDGGRISGFVQDTVLRGVEGCWEVRARVVEICPASLKVFLYGDFFTTSGVAYVSVGRVSA